MSTAEAPFHFNFGAPDGLSSATQAAAGAADQQSDPQTSVEVRPPYQVVHKSIVFTATATILDVLMLTHHASPHLQLSPSLQLDQVTLTDALYLLKVTCDQSWRSSCLLVCKALYKPVTALQTSCS